MNIRKMNKGLDFLREKYGAANGEIVLKGGHCWVGATPLIPGRMERKIVELKKMTENGNLEGVSTLRLAAFAPRGSHVKAMLAKELDLAAYLGANLRDGLKVEDMLMAVGKMKDGTAFLFDPSWSRLEEKIKVPGPGWERFPKRMEVNLTITGDKGMLTCDCFGPNVYHNGAPNDRYTVQYTYFDEWVGLIDEFVDCIRNGKTPLINLKWHKQTIQAMLGCYDSIQSGKISKVG